MQTTQKTHKIGLFTIGIIFSLIVVNSTVKLTFFQDGEDNSRDSFKEWHGDAKVASDPNAFISTWNTTYTCSMSSANNQVKLPLEINGTYDFTVEWGDGTNDTITSWDQEEILHTYSSTGMFTINITGIIIGWRFNEGGDRLKIYEIRQWGALRLGNAGGYFYGCEHLYFNTTDTLDLTGTTTLSNAFRMCLDLKNGGNMNNWDVSNVTDMSYMFAFDQLFNQSLDAWDVSNVTDMSYMFFSASNFNQPLDTWDVSSVSEMVHMFQSALSFNQSIGAWNISRITSLLWMFRNASSFNQPIGTWDVSSVTDMSDIFSGASSFNQPLDTWDVSSVTDMEKMFHKASSFNQPLNTWNVSSVRDMERMFEDASSFNQPLDAWDVSQVYDLESMFEGASSFNQPLGAWNVSSVVDMESMFFGVTLSTSNYDDMLMSWSELPLQSGVVFDAGNSQYSDGAAATARQLLIDTFGWTITDGGQANDDGIPGFPPLWFGIMMLVSLFGLAGYLRIRRR
jgi:surface protein